jgi:arsenate reductase
MKNIQIYHNPRCSKSRAGLTLLEEQGIEPEIIRYLDTPPPVAELTVLLQKLDMKPRELMRIKEDIYKELGLGEIEDDTKLIEAMSAHPKLIERPIVVKGDSAVIGRPMEYIVELLNKIE